LDEAEYHLKNDGDLGGCYPDLHDSSDDANAEFNNNKLLFYHSLKIIPSLKTSLFIGKFRR